MITTAEFKEMGYVVPQDFYQHLLELRMQNDVDKLLEYMHDMSKKQKKELIDYLDGVADNGEAYGDIGHAIYSLKNIAFRAL